MSENDVPSDEVEGRTQCIVMAARGATTRQIADRVGRSERTVQRWLADPEVRAEIDAARRLVVSGMLASLEQGAREAVAVLRRVLHESTNDAVRVRAAGTLLTHLASLREHVDLSERIAALEQEAIG